MKTSILYLMRHLAAREPLFVGKSIQVEGAPNGITALVGNGIHPDTHAHLQASEYQKAEEIGETLAVPSKVKSILIYPSPLPRADETARHMFIGMAKAYARNVLGLEDITTEDAKKVLSKKGLHKLADHRFFNGLIETAYKNSLGKTDDGNELVAQAYDKEVNPDFAGYKWMVQKGFENDLRSEHPGKIALRAIHGSTGDKALGNGLVHALARYDLTLATSHQPNIEIITAYLTDNIGKDANELFDRAGGAYAMGGGFKLSAIYDEGKGFVSATLIRSPDSKGTNLEKRIEIDYEVLNKNL